MSSDDVTKSQAATIHDALFKGVNYLYRLRAAMEKRGFKEDDKHFQLVCKAYNASWELSIEVHRMSCSGAGHNEPD